MVSAVIPQMVTLFALFGPGNPPALPPPPEKTDPARVVIGSLAAQTLIATNLNVGLAVELRQAQKGNLKVVVDVMTMTEAQVNTSVKFLEDYRKQVRLAKEDAKYLDQVLDGLRSVSAQAAAIQRAVKDPDQKHMDEYLKHRKKVAALLEKLVKESAEPSAAPDRAGR